MSPKIELVADDLLQQKGDACVSSIHRSRDLKKGRLAKQILEAAGAAGQELQTEIESKNSGKELYQGEVVRANPKGLLASNVKHLYFVCLKKWQEGNDADVQKALDWILKDADRKKLSTIIIPPLGTGGQSYPPKPVALAILQAVIAYSIDNPNTNITTVKIALFHQKNVMLEAFTDILEEGVSITSQGEMTAGADQQEKKDNVQGEMTAGADQQKKDNALLRCLTTIFVRPAKKNYVQRIASWFGRPPPIFAFQIGPANLSALPYINVQQRGAGVDVTFGLTISSQLLPPLLSKKLLNLG